MQNKNNNRRQSSFKSSGSSKSNFRGSSNSSRYGSRNRGGRGRGRGRGGGRNFSKKIPHAMYVSKAEVVAEVDQYIAENDFQSFDLHRALLNNILERGYEVPTKNPRPINSTYPRR